MLHSPFLLQRQRAQRQLGEVLGVFFFNLYPETQRTNNEIAACLEGGRETRFSEVEKQNASAQIQKLPPRFDCKV